MTILLLEFDCRKVYYLANNEPVLILKDFFYKIINQKYSIILLTNNSLDPTLYDVFTWITGSQHVHYDNVSPMGL